MSRIDISLGNRVKSIATKLKHTLIPSSREDFQARVRENSAIGCLIDDRFAQELAALEEMLRSLTLQLRGQLQHVELAFGETGAEQSKPTTGSISVMKHYQDNLSLFEALKSRHEYVMQRQKELQHLSATYACQQATGYTGLSEWSKIAYESYSDLFTAMTAIGFVGAGLTYSTIFRSVSTIVALTASRGDVGLMSWSFALFIVVTIVPAFTQTSLSYGTKLPAAYPLLVPAFWDSVLIMLGLIPLVALWAAISFLIVTVYFLPSLTGDYTEDDVMKKAQDAAILIIAALGVVCALTLIVAFLALLGRIFLVLMNRRNLKAESRKELLRDKKLSDFEF